MSGLPLNDKLHEECGVVGIFDQGDINSSQRVYYALMALQHRGQESAGIAVNNDGIITCYKDMGLVAEVFDQRILNLLHGDMSIGHVRYSSSKDNFVINAQPLVAKYKNGSLAVAHNGNLVNAHGIREEFEDQGLIFTTSTDSEVIASLIARSFKGNIEDAILHALSKTEGSYALVIMTESKLIGARDKRGMRPLVLGSVGNGFALASETCALDTIGAKYIRDVEPGEIIIIDKNGYKSLKAEKEAKAASCIFEYIYFARADSFIDNISVYDFRVDSGRILAKEQPVSADIVISVPDSGTPAAIGYAKESGIPFCEGLIKNRYVGRTFILPDQSMREIEVSLKLNPLRKTVKGKRLVIVDDSIVRGTTSKIIIEALRNAGAAEVHVRVASPPVRYPCYFGIDTPTSAELIGAQELVENIRKKIGADSVGYISKEGLLKAAGVANPTESGFCTACFSGDYPIEMENYKGGVRR